MTILETPRLILRPFDEKDVGIAARRRKDRDDFRKKPLFRGFSTHVFALIREQWLRNRAA
jgi:hypothetical protein